MANTNKSEITLISKNVDDIYLSYVNGEYILFFKDGNPSKFPNMDNPQELYDNFITCKNYDDLDNDNKLIIKTIESKRNESESQNIFLELINDLYELYYNIEPNEVQKIVSERLKTIDNPNIEKRFRTQINEFEKSKYLEYKQSVIQKLDKRKKGDVDNARRDLANFLTKKYGAILRKTIKDLYLLDGDGFVPVDHDSMILKLKDDFGSNFIHDDDLKKAIGYIDDRREPIPNIVKFKNCLYDMDKLEIKSSEDPIFTLLQIDYNLNPNAQSKLFKNFLYTTFKRDSDEETARAVKGVFQLCGYFFTSGNKYNILPIFTGLTGAGKSTFFNIITHIFGDAKISGVSLQDLEKDSHAGSEFIESHLNIIRDSDTSMIENNSLLKNLTGNESFRVNPKYKPSLNLSPAEVPKPVLVCNTMPVFKIYEPALISRFLIIEFKKSFRDSDERITDLDKLIIADTSEIEWFIYNSIMTYKEMVENGDNFIFKITDEETMELVNKHTHPLNHIIRELILKHDPQAYVEEKTENRENFRPVFTNDLVDVILLYSEKNSIDVPTDKHNRINKKKLINVIKEEFDLYDGELIYNSETKECDIHRDYKARAERWVSPENESIREKVYPNLIATPLYRRLIDEIEAEKILKNHSITK